MNFDPENKIVQLCSRGMELEGRGQHSQAAEIFMQAWESSETNFEKFTAAHYVARHQQDVSGKLNWDETALHYAMKTEDESVKLTLPSLHLNIGKCYEDLANIAAAKNHYLLAHSYVEFLPDDGYGQMIRSGVKKALERIGTES